MSKREKGSGLIEALTVVALTALMVGMAVSGFDSMRINRRLEGIAGELWLDIQLTRSDAVARNSALRIEFQSDARGSCYLIHTGSAGQCTCVSTGAATCTHPDASIVKSVGLPASNGISLASNVSYVLFDPTRGTASPTGWITLTGTNGRSLKHIVSILGRTRTCSPQGKAWGHPAC